MDFYDYRERADGLGCRRRGAELAERPRSSLRPQVSEVMKTKDDPVIAALKRIDRKLDRAIASAVKIVQMRVWDEERKARRRSKPKR